MKITTRLTILFTLITATILLAFAFAIYYSAKIDRDSEFYERLKIKGVTKAELYFDAKANVRTLQEIHLNNLKIMNEAEIAIYDTHYNLLYHDNPANDFVKETPELLDRIAKTGKVEKHQGDWQVLGMKYTFQGNHYIITVAAYDHYGYNKIASMLKSMVIAFVLAIAVIWIAGYFFARKAFEPVIEMTRKVKKITANQLHVRLNTSGSKDEISELANTFNEMLNRLENSFEAQKHFVSNISHEVRTPLFALITELEWSSDKERQPEEYRKAIQVALADARKMVRLSTSLLDFARASYDPSEIAFKTVRIDEVLIEASQVVQKANPAYKIGIVFEDDFQDDNQISVRGNEYLLRVAFINIFENGCKFSKQEQVTATISFRESNIRLAFMDNGVGISEEDLQHIFKPFFRGDNQKVASGNGIGLPLTQKIVTLHQGTIAVNAIIGEGTTITIELPHL